MTRHLDHLIPLFPDASSCVCSGNRCGDRICTKLLKHILHSGISCRFLLPFSVASSFVFALVIDAVTLEQLDLTHLTHIEHLDSLEQLCTSQNKQENKCNQIELWCLTFLSHWLNGITTLIHKSILLLVFLGTGSLLNSGNYGELCIVNVTLKGKIILL